MSVPVFYFWRKLWRTLQRGLFAIAEHLLRDGVTAVTFASEPACGPSLFSSLVSTVVNCVSRRQNSKCHVVDVPTCPHRITAWHHNMSVMLISYRIYLPMYVTMSLSNYTNAKGKTIRSWPGGAAVLSVTYFLAHLWLFSNFRARGNAKNSFKTISRSFHKHCTFVTQCQLDK